MESLFKGERLKPIILETLNDDLASAEITRILFTRPNNTKGYWDATVAGTTLVYYPAAGDLNISGDWQFEAYIEIAGLPGLGDIAIKRIDISLL